MSTRSFSSSRPTCSGMLTDILTGRGTVACKRVGKFLSRAREGAVFGVFQQPAREVSC